MSAEYTPNPDLNNLSSMDEDELSNVFSDLAYERILQREIDTSSPWRFPTNCLDNFQSFHNFATIPELDELDNSFNDKVDLLESFRKQLDDFSAEANLSDIENGDTFANISSLSTSTSSVGDLEKYPYLDFLSSVRLNDHYESEKLSPDSPSPDSSFELFNASFLPGAQNLDGMSIPEDIAPLAVNSPENAENSNLESTNSSAIYEPVKEMKTVWGEMITFSQVIYPNLELIWKPETLDSQTVNAETLDSQTVNVEIVDSQTINPETVDSQTVTPETVDSKTVNPLCTTVIDRKNLVWYTPSISSPRLLMIPIAVEEPENLSFEIYFPFFPET